MSAAKIAQFSHGGANWRSTSRYEQALRFAMHLGAEAVEYHPPMLWLVCTVKGELVFVTTCMAWGPDGPAMEFLW